MHPWDDADPFWRMSPADFECEVAAYRKRQDQLMELAAWMAANIMNPHLKKPVTPAKLLGRVKQASAWDEMQK